MAVGGLIGETKFLPSSSDYMSNNWSTMDSSNSSDAASSTKSRQDILTNILWSSSNDDVDPWNSGQSKSYVDYPSCWAPPDGVDGKDKWCISSASSDGGWANDGGLMMMNNSSLSFDLQKYSSPPSLNSFWAPTMMNSFQNNNQQQNKYGVGVDYFHSVLDDTDREDGCSFLTASSDRPESVPSDSTNDIFSPPHG